MGIPFTRAHGSVRLSLSRYTTEKEVDYIIETIPKVIGRLRDISPFGKEASQRPVAK
jgi:cysteine desulfurase